MQISKREPRKKIVYVLLGVTEDGLLKPYGSNYITKEFNTMEEAAEFVTDIWDEPLIVPKVVWTIDYN